MRTIDFENVGFVDGFTRMALVNGIRGYVRMVRAMLGLIH